MLIGVISKLKCVNNNVFPENVIEMVMNLDEREPINDRIGEI